MRVVVISLEKREDRRKELKRKWPLPGPLQFFDAIPDEDGARGCMESHLALLSSLPDITLILEDDAVFADDFTLDLDPPEDWEVLWLGGEHVIKPRPYNDRWVIPVNMHHTHAYIPRDPYLLSRLMRANGERRLDVYFAARPLRQYALKKFTVGQAAGKSDTTGVVTPEAHFWNEYNW